MDILCKRNYTICGRSYLASPPFYLVTGRLVLVTSYEGVEVASLRKMIALAGVAQWIECWPMNPRLVSLIPSQDMYLGCGPGPQLGVCKRQPANVSLTHTCFSPSLSPSLPISLNENK